MYKLIFSHAIHNYYARTTGLTQCAGLINSIILCCHRMQPSTTIRCSVATKKQTPIRSEWYPVYTPQVFRLVAPLTHRAYSPRNTIEKVSNFIIVFTILPTTKNAIQENNKTCCWLLQKHHKNFITEPSTYIQIYRSYTLTTKRDKTDTTYFYIAWLATIYTYTHWT